MKERCKIETSMWRVNFHLFSRKSHLTCQSPVFIKCKKTKEKGKGKVHPLNLRHSCRNLDTKDLYILYSYRPMFRIDSFASTGFSTHPLNRHHIRIVPRIRLRHVPSCRIVRTTLPDASLSNVASSHCDLSSRLYRLNPKTFKTNPK